MAVRIRLARYGKANSPYYRVVVQDRAKPRDGRFLEIVGTYNPTEKHDKTLCKFNKERLEYWISKGATASETVAQLIKTTYPELRAA